MTSLIDDLSAAELRDLLKLVSEFKNRFSSVAHTYVEEARQHGLPDAAICAAIADECLKLAACIYGRNDPAVFMQCAKSAVEFASRMWPPASSADQ